MKSLHSGRRIQWSTTNLLGEFLKQWPTMFSNWIQNAFCVPQRKLLQQTWHHSLLFENKLIKGLCFIVRPAEEHCQKGCLDLSGKTGDGFGMGTQSCQQHPPMHHPAPGEALPNFFSILANYSFFFLLLSTSLHSSLIPSMFLPLPFFAPSPSWLSAKLFTDGLRSFFSPTWYLTCQHHNNSHYFAPDFSLGHCHSWQSFSLSHAVFGQEVGKGQKSDFLRPAEQWCTASQTCSLSGKASLNGLQNSHHGNEALLTEHQTVNGFQSLHNETQEPFSPPEFWHHNSSAPRLLAIPRISPICTPLLLAMGPIWLSCGAEKGTGTQRGIHFTVFQKITAEQPFSVKSSEIVFVVGSKKKTAGIAPLKYLS